MPYFDMVILYIVKSNIYNMIVDEIIDQIQSDLTVGGLLPCILPTQEIKRLIVKEALPYFYENYQHALQSSYLFVPRENMETDEYAKHKTVILPEEVQNIIWVYMMQNRSLFSLGIGLSGQQSNLSINQGVSNQPFLNSYLSTVGELGVYKTTIDGFGDMLNTLSKHTIKFDYNFASKRLQLLTSVKTDLMLECYLRVPAEDMFEMDMFRRYAAALSKQQLGRLLTRFNFNLPGGVTMNGDAIKTEGDAEVTAIREDIRKNNGNSSFFIMNKK
jgi:hypothetical protein